MGVQYFNFVPKFYQRGGFWSNFVCLGPHFTTKTQFSNNFLIAQNSKQAVATPMAVMPPREALCINLTPGAYDIVTPLEDSRVTEIDLYEQVPFPRPQVPA